MPPDTRVRVAVLGAGAVGCWLGGRLASASARVTLIGRPRVLDELAAGVTTSELDGETRTSLPALSTSPQAAADVDVVLVTVKSGSTVAAAQELAGVLTRPSLIVSLQNGVGNAQVLRKALPDHRVLAGMVPYNIVRRAPGHYHRGSEGVLMFDEDPGAGALVAAVTHAGLAFERRRDMPAVQWSKLVLNLNNAINALSGVPLAAELADRDFRRCLALAQREALEVLSVAQLPLARLTPLPMRWIARLLVAPDPVFRLLARRVVAIDPHARSSMWDDLEASRPTEVDHIQGEIVALAHRMGRAAPVNGALHALVKEAERGGRRDFQGAELYARLCPAPSNRAT